MDGLSLEINNKLTHEPARYGVRKSALRSMFISAGRKDFIANLFTDEVPRRVMIGFVASNSFMGSKFSSPFMFDNFSVREIELMANGRLYPQNPYSLDYGNKLYARAYHDCQEHLGFANTSESNGINYKMYKSGWNIYCFDLTK